MDGPVAWSLDGEQEDGQKLITVKNEHGAIGLIAKYGTEA
jgi:hypothetical protein